jgi:hypothetical protein
VLSLYPIVLSGAICLCGALGVRAQQGHTLIAEYLFNQSVYYGAADVSGNNNSFYGGLSWANSGNTQFSTNGIAGGGSLLLDGGECISMSSPPGSQTFDNWLAAFHGSFSVSLWINTTNVAGNDSDIPNGNNDAAIIWAYSNGSNDTLPVVLTGHKAAFFTGDPTGQNGDTLHSTSDVTTGNFIHIVVTRDQSTGQKSIYINGVLDSSDTATTNNLDGDTGFYSIGGYFSSGYAGLLDDVQLYSGVLNASEVAYLYSHPDTPATNVVAGPFSGLAAYYDFDENTDLAADLTANGNNLINGGSFSGPVLSTNSVSGSGAVYFNGGAFLTPSSNLLSTLAGNFSLSLWVNTTQNFSYDTAPAYYGAGIVSADVSGLTNDLIPMALTGGAIGFNSGGTNDDSINSTTDINDGHYHHVVVTRNQATGEKQIYIDGVFSSNDFATRGLLNASQLITIGALADASQSDPTSPENSGYNGFVGLIDDIQVYSRVLAANEVAALHAQPGSNVTNGLVCHYDFDEGTVLAADVSGHGNNMVFAGACNGGPGPAVTNDAESGSGALAFGGNNYLVPEGNLVTNLAGDFSLSIWLQTTQTFGTAGDPAYEGAGIITAEVPGRINDLVPLALTGGNITFETDGSSQDELTSTATVNDGRCHHVVVTRNQGSGQKQIYIDGALDSADVDDGSYLNGPQILIFGALADASQWSQTSPAYTGYNGYVGLMDQVQFYSRVLSSNEVSYLYANPGSTLSANGSSNNGHTNLLYYSFEDNNIFAHDFSGHGNNVNGVAWDLAPPYITNDAAAGSYAVGFAGGAGGAGWLSVPTNLVATLAGSFSAALWVRTSESRGNDSDTADTGSGLMAANSDQVIPLALTGSKLAFLTGGSPLDTLHSATSINTGNYVHVVVTRDQGSGAKHVYVNGQLNASDFGAPGQLNSSSNPTLSLGTGPSDGNGFAGDMDEVQIYSGVLSSDDVAYLYSHPGTAVPDSVGTEGGTPSFNAALGTTNTSWTTLGAASWFVETTNTYSTNAAAAQSGSIQDNQSSILQATVTGPGTINFYWQTKANNGDDFDLEFDIDGNYQDDVSGQTPWSQDSFQISGSGTHTLTWNANTLADNNNALAADAGFLDQVVFTPAVAPVITLDPFNQTNYPGYSVALLAAATGTPDPTWQWYEVGNSSPIPGATSALFIPADSGTSGVAGGYYAVASNLAGSQTTTTAMVTFVTAPQPPDWSEAIRSPFVNYDNVGVYAANSVYHACLVDATGTNIYATGFSEGTNVFGTNKLTSDINEGYEAVIVKQTAAGTGLWLVAVTNNGNGNSYGEALAPAPGGGIYAAIGFSGTNWLGTNLLEDSGVGSIYLARYDANGNALWSQTITSTNGAFPQFSCLAADPSGNITLTGVVNGSFTIAGTNLTVSGQTGFLGQFNASGALNWAERVPNIIEYLQYSGGRIYASLLNWLSGNTNYTVGGLTNAMARNYTLAAINATNGQGIWLRDVGEASGANPSYLIDDYPEISVSGTNLFLVGTAYGSNAVFGSFTVPIANGRGQYFARYDTNGNAELATGFGSATTQPESSVADAAGNVYVAGNFDTYSYFGNDILAAPRLGTLGNGYYGQAFAAKFDRTGTAQWACMATSTNLTFYPDTDFVTFWGVALGPNGVWACGEGSGAMYFGTNLVNSVDKLFEIGTSTYAEEFISGMLGMITVSEPPSPVQLLNPALAGTNFQFSFVSTADHTNYVQYSTNLANTNWLPYSTIIGDGTTKTVIVPTNHPAAEYFRVGTQ